MATATKSGQNLSFTYNADGLRTTKTVNGVVYTYYYSGGKLMRLTYAGNTLDFFYDQNGTPFMLLQNGNIYYYITNAQGDVIRLVDINGNTAASYRYDPYGKAISALGSHATINPLRYRGYVFDHETGLYYLQSRYYDPEIGRFINADMLASTGQGLLGNNMFAYCGNNPVSRLDSSGMFFKEIGEWLKDAYEEVKEWCHENVGTKAGISAECGVTEYYYVCTIQKGVGYSKDLGQEKAVNFYATINDLQGDASLDASGGIKVNGDDFGVSLEVGTDVSIGMHTDTWNVDVGVNELGRGYGQYTTQHDGAYEYVKFSVNGAEIVGTVLVCIFAPQVLPVIAVAVAKMSLSYA